MDLTFFTIPKAFSPPHWRHAQYNAIRSWKRLGPDKILLCSQDKGVKEAAEELGCVHLKVQLHEKFKLPLIQSSFDRAQAAATSRLMCFVNADVILMDDFKVAVELIAGRFKTFLMVGRRWGLKIRDPLDFSTGWQERLRKRQVKEGRLDGRAALEVHVFNRGLFGQRTVPRAIVGRWGADLWLAQHVMERGLPVIDATKAVVWVHQDPIHSTETIRTREQTAYNDSVCGNVSKGHVGYATWELTEEMKLVKREKLPAPKWWPSWFRG